MCQIMANYFVNKVGWFHTFFLPFDHIFFSIWHRLKDHSYIQPLILHNLLFQVSNSYSLLFFHTFVLGRFWCQCSIVVLLYEGSTKTFVSSCGVSVNDQSGLSNINMYAIYVCIWDCSIQFSPFSTPPSCVFRFSGGCKRDMTSLLHPSPCIFLCYRLSFSCRHFVPHMLY